MKALKPVTGLLLVLMCSALCPVSGASANPDQTQPATKPAASGQFLRFVDDGHGGGKLEAAIATYQNAAGVKVDLISAVHVGEKAYYESLNKTFEQYDALLYEMVKPRGAAAPRLGQRSHSAIGGFQRLMKDALHLDYQLDDIDYTPPNFVHADLNAESFAARQDARGESIFGMMLKSMLHEMSRQAQAQDSSARPIDLIDLLIVLRSPDRPRQMKLLLAQQFDHIEDQMAGMDGPDGSAIITDRNTRCLEVLKKSIGDGRKNIGIFYGAGHMHDLSQRLEAQGFKQVRIEWRMAWDMTATLPTTRPATMPAILP